MLPSHLQRFIGFSDALKPFFSTILTNFWIEAWHFVTTTGHAVNTPSPSCAQPPGSCQDDILQTAFGTSPGHIMSTLSMHAMSLLLQAMSETFLSFPILPYPSLVFSDGSTPFDLHHLWS